MNGRRDGTVAMVAASVIAISYAVLGLAVLVPEGIYSGDIGVKFVQARALTASHFRSLDIPYPGAFLDPAREFFPIRPPFILTAGSETQGIFSTTSAVLQAPLATAAGVDGLVILSLLSAAVILFAAMRLAPVAQKTAVVVALGLGSPLWLHAVLGWDHAPAVAFSTAAFAVALTSSGISRALIAGVLIGIAALLRDEAILVLPGLLLMIAVRHRSVRPVAIATAAAVGTLAVSAGIDVFWFERPAAAHLRHAVDLVEGIAQEGAIEGAVPSLGRLSFRERYDIVFEYWLLGWGNDWWILGFVSMLALALVYRWRVAGAGGSIPLLLWITAVLVVAAADVWELVTAPKWFPGLQRVSPFLVFAILPPPSSGERDRRIGYTGVVLLTTAMYLLVSLAVTNTAGGKGLGARLLLPLLPLLAVAAIGRIATYRRAAGAWDRWIGRAGAALVAGAVLMHVGGTIPAYRARNHGDAAAVLTAKAADARVIVADDPFTAQLFFPLYYRKIILLADSHESRAQLGAVLADAKVPEVLLVSRHPEPGLRLSPLRLRKSDNVGRMFVQYWGRVGRALD